MISADDFNEENSKKNSISEIIRPNISSNKSSREKNEIKAPNKDYNNINNNNNINKIHPSSTTNLIETNTTTTTNTNTNINTNKPRELINLPTTEKLKTHISPDAFRETASTAGKVNKLIPISKNILNKGLNVIPIKPFNKDSLASGGLTEAKTTRDRLSPKPKDVRIPNVSPKNKIPVTSRNNAEAKPNFDTKYTNKFYMNIQSNMISKSPSPKHYDINALKKKIEKK